MEKTKIPLNLTIKKQKRAGTISQPSQTDAIVSLAKVLYRHIMSPEHIKEGEQPADRYDVDNFIRQQFRVQVPVVASTCGFFSFKQEKKRNHVPVPDEEKIQRFAKRMIEKARLNAECAIISLIYIERLMDTHAVNLTSRNWIPILVVAMLTASKVWDDHSTFNGDLPAILPIFTVQDINDLERMFLGDLSYSLHISSSDYAKYYFGMRSLRKTEVRNIPKYYLSIGLGGAMKVDKKTLESEGIHRGIPLSL